MLRRYKRDPAMSRRNWLVMNSVLDYGSRPIAAMAEGTAGCMVSALSFSKRKRRSVSVSEGVVEPGNRNEPTPHSFIFSFYSTNIPVPCCVSLVRLSKSDSSTRISCVYVFIFFGTYSRSKWLVFHCVLILMKRLKRSLREFSEIHPLLPPTSQDSDR